MIESEHKALAYYMMRHPEQVVLLTIGMRYAPSITLALAKEYTKNIIKFAGSNLKSTAKVVASELKPRGRRGVPRGARRMGVPRGMGWLGLLVMYPDVKSAVTDPGQLLQPGGVYGSDHSGGWFFGVPLESPMN